MRIPFLILAIVFFTLYITEGNNPVYLILSIVFGVLVINLFFKEKKDTGQ